MPQDSRSAKSKKLRRTGSLRSIKQNIMPTTSIEPQLNSRLLQLPAELRNLLYEYALSDTIGPDERLGLHELRLPPLFFTCRQTLFETPGIFFTCNAFTLVLRETEHARIPKLLDAGATNAMALLKRLGVRDVPVEDIIIEKQQPLCGRARKGPDLVLLATLATLAKPSPASSSWIQCTDQVWKTWRPKLES